MVQGSRLGSIHVQLALLVKPAADKPILARSACAGKPRDPPGAASYFLDPCMASNYE